MWALGAILYELCALKPPFSAVCMPALVMQICGAPPPPLPPDYSAELRSLAIDQLLCKEAEERPRVHAVLEVPFVKRRIEKFLEAKLMQQARDRPRSEPGEPPCARANPRGYLGEYLGEYLAGVLAHRHPRRIAGAAHPRTDLGDPCAEAAEVGAGALAKGIAQGGAKRAGG